MTNEVRALWLLRHGQSEGNVARDAAEVAQAHELDIADRDMDVPLSDLGRRQAVAFGRWLADQPEDERPDVVLSSPYRRAADTARLVVETAGVADGHVRIDDRLREREFGILDLLTHRGVEARHPEDARRRERLGKFYYRAPGGESWVDVALRLRSLRDSIVREHADRRVLIVAHEVPLFIMRYLIEELDEAGALALSRNEPLANCGLTTFERDPDGLLGRKLVNWTAPLDVSDTPVTEDTDAPVASR